MFVAGQEQTYVNNTIINMIFQSPFWHIWKLL